MAKSLFEIRDEVLATGACGLLKERMSLRDFDLIGEETFIIPYEARGTYPKRRPSTKIWNCVCHMSDGKGDYTDIYIVCDLTDFQKPDKWGFVKSQRDIPVKAVYLA